MPDIGAPTRLANGLQVLVLPLGAAPRVHAALLDGGIEDREEPPLRDEWGNNTSNVIHIRHDRRAVHYLATAEVTCVAAGEVRSEERPDVLFGLEWDYSDGDSGGNLNRNEPEGNFPFTCEE